MKRRRRAPRAWAPAIVFMALPPVTLTAEWVALESSEVAYYQADELDQYGHAIDSFGDSLLVGSPGRLSDFSDPVYGKVTLYSKDAGGTLVPVFQADGPAGSDDRQFGTSVALGDGFFAVGSFNPFDRDTNPLARIYIFDQFAAEGAGWGLSEVITYSEGPSIAAQRIAVRCDGEKIYAGLSGMNVVLVIGRGDGIAANWKIEEVVPDPTPGFNHKFGVDLDVSGDWMIVGARTDGSVPFPPGAVHFLRRQGSSWVPVQKMTSPNPDDYRWFGYRVQISGEWSVAMESWGGATSMYKLGAENQRWELRQTILVPDWAGSVCLQDDTLLLGSPTSRNGSGEVSVYTLSESSEWQHEGYLYPHERRFGLRHGGEVLVGDSHLYIACGFLDGGAPQEPVAPVMVYDRQPFQTYQSWLTRHFGPDADLQPSSKANASGTTLMEAYAMGVPPYSQGTDHLPNVFQSDARVVFRFRRNPNAVEAGLVAQSSRDGRFWSEMDLQGFSVTYDAGLLVYSYEVLAHDLYSLFRLRTVLR